VFAIESQPRCHPIISENLRFNNCRNMTVLQVAVSDFAGYIKLYLHPESLSI